MNRPAVANLLLFGKGAILGSDGKDKDKNFVEFHQIQEEKDGRERICSCQAWKFA